MPDSRSAESGEENSPFVCAVDDKVLHKVGVHILDLFECPRLEGSALKTAFEREPCVQSVEFSQEVQIVGQQQVDNKEPSSSAYTRFHSITHRPPPDSQQPYVPRSPFSTIVPLRPDERYTIDAIVRLRLDERNPADAFYSASGNSCACCFPCLGLPVHSTDGYGALDPVNTANATLLLPLKYLGDPSSPPYLLSPMYAFPCAEQAQPFNFGNSPSPVFSFNEDPVSHLYWRDIAGFTAATGLAACDRSTVVALVDTGIALRHSRLNENLWVNTGEIPDNNIDDDGNGFVDDVHGFNFINFSGDVDDDNGHGTHCAGLIGGSHDLGTGTEGVCESVRIAALKFLDKAGSGSSANAVQALNYALQMGFPISNHSWGGEHYSGALKRAVSKANDEGHLFVTAAGNRGLNIDVYPTYPAALRLPNVITVAATDRNDQLASFSNTGVHSVHTAAPGVSILSTFPPNQFAVLSGTSIATPIVSGLAALLMSVPESAVSRKVKMLLIKEAILKGVNKLQSVTGRVASGGRVNAEKSIHTLWQNTRAKVKTQVQADEEVEILQLSCGMECGKISRSIWPRGIVTRSFQSIEV